MNSDKDSIIRKAIKSIAQDLSEEDRQKARERCIGKSLLEQLDIVTEIAMRDWKPKEEWLMDDGSEDEKRKSGKDAAAGE